jgi:hypothetical protein
MNILLIVIVFLISSISFIQNSYQQQQENNNTTNALDDNNVSIVQQRTVMSKTASVSIPGQQPHEVVFALPLREDGKIWSGTATFTASKPIEVEILHNYNPTEIIDSEHGEPYNVVLGDKRIAITQLKNIVDQPLEVNDTLISSGTFNFVGNALIFHKTNPEPFTVTYTIDVQAKEIQ